MKLKASFLLSLALSSTQLFAQASNGWGGDSGRSGENRTITALGPIAVNLSGARGEDGGRGSDGSSGRCNSYTNEEGNTVNDDVRGDDGGRGGNGGDGGNGGNLTILFSEIVNLKDIQFISRGGEGGYGGSGGHGGYGCPSGAAGSDGYSGDRGRSGSLYLVHKEFHPYQIDTSNQQNVISSIMNGRDIVKNIWEATDGKALMASGSAFGSAFMLRAYEYGTAQVSLKDSSKIDPRLLQSKLSVVMKDGVTKIQPNYDLIMVAKHSPDSPNAILEIERLYNTFEFQSIGFEKVFKKNNSRYLHLTTDKDLLPRPILSMKLKVEVKGRWFRYHESFNDEVPAALIETIKSGYTIDLDALPLKIKIPVQGKIRLTMNYKLQEMDLKTEGEEVWVVKMKHVSPMDAVKEN